MQTRLTERAANRDAMMEKLEKMEEIYDKLQAVAKKQSLLRKSDRKIRYRIGNCNTYPNEHDFVNNDRHA